MALGPTLPAVHSECRSGEATLVLGVNQAHPSDRSRHREQRGEEDVVSCITRQVRLKKNETLVFSRRRAGIPSVTPIPHLSRLMHRGQTSDQASSDPEPGWSSPVEGEGTIEPTATPAPQRTWGQVLLGGSSGDQLYIHNVLQHITNAATERHRKRKRSHGHRGRERRKEKSRKSSRSRKRRTRHPRSASKRSSRSAVPSSPSATSSSESDPEERKVRRRRKRRDEGEKPRANVSPLLHMVMSDLTGGFFDKHNKEGKREGGGVPHGLGLGEGLGLGALNATQPSPQIGVVRSHCSPRHHQPSALVTHHHTLLEPPQFPLPLMNQDRHLPPPLPVLQASASIPYTLHADRHAAWLPPQHYANSLRPIETEFRTRPSMPPIPPEWHPSSDPPSDGEEAPPKVTGTGRAHYPNGTSPPIPQR